jgi:hypothetical protein
LINQGSGVKCGYSDEEWRNKKGASFPGHPFSIKLKELVFA